jgi:hypothetical protein
MLMMVIFLTSCTNANTQKSKDQEQEKQPIKQEADVQTLKMMSYNLKFASPTYKVSEFI